MSDQIPPTGRPRRDPRGLPRQPGADPDAVDPDAVDPDAAERDQERSEADDVPTRTAPFTVRGRPVEREVPVTADTDADDQE